MLHSAAMIADSPPSQVILDPAKHSLPRAFTTSAEWRKEIDRLYSVIRSQENDRPSLVCGNEIIVHPQVYAPDVFTDTSWFASVLSDARPSARVLEVGVGTGAIAVAMAAAGARVVGTDANLLAVENARLNATRHPWSNIDIQHADVYPERGSSNRFDLIFWAHPFNDWEDPAPSPLSISGIDPRYRSLELYVSRARDWLTPGGTFLLGTGSSANLERILQLATAFDFEAFVRGERRTRLGLGSNHSITYYILELVPKKPRISGGFSRQEMCVVPT